MTGYSPLLIPYPEDDDPFAYTDLAIKAMVDRIDYLLPRDFYKGADESVTSSAVLQDDNDFQFSAVSGEAYEIELYLILSSAANAAGDIKTAWVHPGGTFHMFSQGPDPTLASGSITGAVELRVTRSIASGSTLDAFGCSTTRLMVKLHCHYLANASGLVKFQWAQNASNANATTVGAGSHMVVRRKSM